MTAWVKLVCLSYDSRAARPTSQGWDPGMCQRFSLGLSWSPHGLLEGTVMDTTLSKDSHGLPAGLQEEAGLVNTVTEVLQL